jgi:hypothetical protein
VKRHIIETLTAFGITAAGLALAVSIVWQLESRAIAKAVTFGGAR